jgi:hypothetical protein
VCEKCVEIDGKIEHYRARAPGAVLLECSGYLVMPPLFTESFFMPSFDMAPFDIPSLFMVSPAVVPCTVAPCSTALIVHRAVSHAGACSYCPVERPDPSRIARMRSHT